MKKTIILSVLAALLLTLPLAQSVSAKNDKAEAGKFWVCHEISVVSDGENFFTAVTNSLIPEGDPVGQMILVSGNAVSAHCGHGDRVFDFSLLGGQYEAARGYCRPDRGPGGLDLDCSDF